VKKCKRPKLAEILEESDESPKERPVQLKPVIDWSQLNFVENPELRKIDEMIERPNNTLVQLRPVVVEKSMESIPIPKKVENKKERKKEKKASIEEDKEQLKEQEKEEPKEELKEEEKNPCSLMNKLKEKGKGLSITIPAANKRQVQFVISSVNQSNSVKNLGTPSIASGFPMQWDKILARDESLGLLSPLLFANSGADSKIGPSPFFVLSSNERSAGEFYNSAVNQNGIEKWEK